jgi:hypothetical protein
MTSNNATNTNIGTTPNTNNGTTSINNIGTTPINNNTPKHIYMALYSSCIYESDYETLSCHITRKGANKAIENHIIDEYNKHLISVGYQKQFWYEYLTEQGISDIEHPFEPSIFGNMANWKVKKVKLME